MTRTTRLLALLAVPAIVAAFGSPAHGHARLKSPAPRDNHSDYKSPPVGNVGIGEPCGVARTASQPSTTLTPGAQLTVTWEETVTHNGCFVVDFSASGDANFQVLGVKSHANPPAPTTPSTQMPRPWSVGITVPTAPCTACTLRVRQLMLASNVADNACPPATIPAGATYYSCANVVIGAGGSGGSGGAGGSGGGGGATGGATGAGGRGGATGGATGSGGRGGNTGGGRGGTPGTGGATAGTSGQAGNGASGEAGTSGQAGDNGQAGTSGQAGSGSSGEAGATGQAGNGSSGAAGSAGLTGTTGQAGTTGGSGVDEVSGGCQVVGGAPAPLALLLALALFRRRRPRSRS